MKFWKALKRLVYITLIPVVIYSQHRGDNLSFQGISFVNGEGVFASAFGGAFTSRSGNLDALFYNPAGLIGINSLQLSTSGNYYSKMWRENQEYRPNRFFVTLPFYLEGLYIPDPADDGRWDHERAQDTTKPYIVNTPVMGVDPYSKEAADWENEKNSFSFQNIAAAYPFDISGNKIVAGLSYSKKFNVLDFDRNDTHLDPHIGYDQYGSIGRVNGLDTLVMKWSKFLRLRTGEIHTIAAALAYQLSDEINIGIGANILWGESDDLQYLDRVGSFDLIRKNRFRFYYQKSYDEISGLSKYSGLSFNIGLQVDLNFIKAGLTFALPYTLERKWDYVKIHKDSISNSQVNLSGTDKLSLPVSISVGVSFKPMDEFILAIDYEFSPLSKTEFSTTGIDTTYRNYVDRHSLRFGAEYIVSNYLSVMIGYANIPELFVPDGSAFNDRGPAAGYFSAGFSLSFWFGTFDAAFIFNQLKYYDSYFSNTNYVLEKYNSYRFAYTYKF
jgi:hypothetical protein